MNHSYYTRPRDEIQRAHDLFYHLANDLLPTDLNETERLIIAAKLDVLGWVLGGNDQFSQGIEQMLCELAAAGIGFGPVLQERN